MSERSKANNDKSEEKINKLLSSEKSQNDQDKNKSITTQKSTDTMVDESKNKCLRCLNCFSIPLLLFNNTTHSIKLNCNQGHNISIDIKDYLEKGYTNNFYNQICSQCKSKIDVLTERRNYYCKECNEIFCRNCIKNHNLIFNNNNDNQNVHHFINLEKYDTTCILHNETFDYFCCDCNNNICQFCYQCQHKTHKIIDLDDINLKRKEFTKIKDYLNLEKESLNIASLLMKKLIIKIKKEVKKILEYKEAELKFKESVIKIYERKIDNYNIIKNVKNLLFNNSPFVIDSKKSYIEQLNYFYEYMNKGVGKIKPKKSNTSLSSKVISLSDDGDCKVINLNIKKELNKSNAENKSEDKKKGKVSTNNSNDKPKSSDKIKKIKNKKIHKKDEMVYHKKGNTMQLNDAELLIVNKEYENSKESNKTKTEKKKDNNLINSFDETENRKIKNMQKIYINEEKDLNKTDVSRAGNTIESEKNENNKSQTKKVKIKKIVKKVKKKIKVIDTGENISNSIHLTGNVKSVDKNNDNNNNNNNKAIMNLTDININNNINMIYLEKEKQPEKEKEKPASKSKEKENEKENEKEKEKEKEKEGEIIKLKNHNHKDIENNVYKKIKLKKNNINKDNNKFKNEAIKLENNKIKNELKKKRKLKDKSFEKEEKKKDAHKNPNVNIKKIFTNIPKPEKKINLNILDSYRHRKIYNKNKSRNVSLNFKINHSFADFFPPGNLNDSISKKRIQKIFRDPSFDIKRINRLSNSFSGDNSFSLVSGDKLKAFNFMGQQINRDLKDAFNKESANKNNNNEDSPEKDKNKNNIQAKINTIKIESNMQQNVNQVNNNNNSNSKNNNNDEHSKKNNNNDYNYSESKVAKDNELYLSDGKTLNEFKSKTLKLTVKEYENTVFSILEINSSIFAVGFLNGEIDIYDTNEIVCLFSVTEHNSRINNMFLLKEPNTILSASFDYTMKKIKLIEEKKTYVVEFVFDGYDNIIYKGIELNNENIISISFGGEINVWNKLTSKAYAKSKKIIINNEELYDIIEINNKLLAISSDENLRFFNINTNKKEFLIENKVIGDLEFKRRNNMILLNNNILGILLKSEVGLIDIVHKQIITKCKIYEGKPETITLMKDKTVLISISNYNIKDYDEDTEEKIERSKMTKTNKVIFLQYELVNNGLSFLIKKEEVSDKINSKDYCRITSVLEFNNGIIIFSTSGMEDNKMCGTFSAFDY